LEHGGGVYELYSIHSAVSIGHGDCWSHSHSVDHRCVLSVRILPSYPTCISLTGAIGTTCWLTCLQDGSYAMIGARDLGGKIDFIKLRAALEEQASTQFGEGVEGEMDGDEAARDPEIGRVQNRLAATMLPPQTPFLTSKTQQLPVVFQQEWLVFRQEWLVFQ
ncbi:hypothetical protein JG688_00000603, partial [Phytophthora aleatoria]